MATRKKKRSTVVDVRSHAARRSGKCQGTKSPKASTGADIYQIKVTLRHVKPPVWRRLEVPADIRLGKLHEVLQIAMGWTDSHLHGFRKGHDSYGVPDPDFPGDFKNERNVRFDHLAAEGETIVYDYDFGDNWEHDIKIEKVVPPQKGVHYPRCTKGKGACPPEDCGGPWAYAELLSAIKNPKQEEHEELLEWVGVDFDPACFDMEEVNAAYELYFKQRK